MRVFVEVKGFEQLRAGFTQLGRQLEEPQPILEAVAERAFYPIVQEIFASEGRGQWDDLSEGYKERKQIEFGDKPIMQATGALVESLEKKGAKMNIHTAQGRDSLLLGSAIIYSRAASKKRPVFMFNQQDFNRMGEAAAEKIKEEGRQSGFQVK